MKYFMNSWKVFCLFFVLVAAFSFVGCSRSKGDKDKDVIKKGLNPNNVDLSKPIPVSDLKYAYFAWKGKKVTIKGYCNFFFDEGSIGKRINLVGAFDSKEKLVDCEMDKSYDEKFSKKIPVVITGNIKGVFFKVIQLTNCKMISKGDDSIKTIKADPYNIDLSKPAHVSNFYKSYFGWIGKEISVIGYYFGTTTSTTKYGKTIRVDLKNPKTGEIEVGCEMKEEHERIIKRNGVIIKGIVTRSVFGRVRLTNCEFVK